MKSFGSVLIRLLVLVSIYGSIAQVDARVGNHNNAKSVSSYSANPESYESSASRRISGDVLELVGRIREWTTTSRIHRSLGGGIASSSSSEQRRRLYQDWARDEDGKLLWWIWVVIGCSIALCFVLCCCTSVCCLRD